ncbi:segment polarity dishevelled -like protein [Brachionus plicatilis]|uniref:Segment polarity dishevelled-like protein n=1 Tax=Brachionus plicatilis TaxID=10195 RepID=A0A3M7SRZ2_BRAPC|nr:segment polarity dishevelled -like protein [Brachionus plicatilis]
MITRLTSSHTFTNRTEMEATKIIYYTHGTEMPFLITINIAPEKARLKDFKQALNCGLVNKNTKYFFKAIVDDFGTVKEELSDDDAVLPSLNGRVVAWLIQVHENKSNRSFENRTQDEHSNIENFDSNRQKPKRDQHDTLNSRKNKNSRAQVNPLKDLNHHDETSTETESLINAFGDLKVKKSHKNSTNHKHDPKPRFNSFSNHGNHHVRPIKQKLSLDSHHYQRGHHVYHHPGVHHVKKSQKHSDSFSDEDSEDDNSEICDSNFITQTAAPSMLSSETDTTTFFDSENDDDDGQFSSITGDTTTSTFASRKYGHNRNRKRHKHKIPHANYLKGPNSLHSSMSSLADSTMSLNIITVTLNMDTVNFLGISIVGQSNKGGEGGIYVGSIMNGGAVALDGRIEPGDMILQVNDISFENMSNDDAVKVLREAVMKPGPVKLVVAKCWDPNPKGYFTVSKQEPVRPIDPSTWVAHTQAHTGIGQPNYINSNAIYPNGGLKTHQHRLNHSISSFGSTSSLTTSIADTTLTNSFNVQGHHNYGNGFMGTTTTTMNGGDSTRYGGNEQLNLTTNTDMEVVVRSMAAADSGLDIRDRNWLKITIPMAFIGSDVVDWLLYHVEGFPDRRDARKYACNLLKHGYIRHAVNKMRFSEQCYYVFGDFNQTNQFQNGQTLFTLNEESEADFDSVSEFERDTLYAHMTFPPPGSYNTNIYQQSHPKIYSNLNGIGGPPPPPLSYMSSSSSNATSNSTSTTSNNTTSQTMATSQANASINSTTNQMNSQNSCQFYIPAPSQLQMTSLNNTANSTNVSSSSMLFKQTTFDNHEDLSANPGNLYGFDSTNPPNSMSQSQFSNGNTTGNATQNGLKNTNFNLYQQNSYNCSGRFI